MRFYIHSDRYINEPAAGETVPIKEVASNRMLFLKSTAEKLLHTTDKWVEFDKFCSDADAALKKDYLDGLTLLECFDIAEVADVPVPDTNGCRVAGERDYKAVGEFMQANVGKGFSVAAIRDSRYYTEDSVRARQFLNQEYNFIREQNGKIQAVLVISVPRPENVSSTASVESIVFAEALREDAAADCVDALVKYAEAEFKGDICKFRFTKSDACHAWMVSKLAGLGFEPVCTLEKELYRSVDVTFYDKMIGA